MRVSEQLIKLFWLPVLTLALTAGTNLSMAMGQIVVPATEHLTDDVAVTGTSTAPAAGSANEWLTRARQATLDRDFQLAEQYIQLAEELYQQRPAGTKLNFTPEMARQELADMRSRTSATASEATHGVTQAGKEFPVAAMSVPQVSADDIQTAARRALLKSRQALAHGDVETATLMANSAKQYPIDFAAIGDSPQALEMMIFHQNNLAALAAAKDKTYNQRAAMFLLQQAQSLIGYEDFETASSLIDQAKSFPVEFTPGPQHPDSLLALIESAPKASPVNDAKAAVMKLMSQAQFAADQRQWENAKSFVDQAKSFNLPDSEFAAGETRPWQLELQITQALNMQSFSGNTGEIAQTNFTDDDPSKVVQADYDPTTDTTHNAQVSGYDPINPDAAAATDSDDRLAKFPEFNPIPSRGMQLYRSGLQALDSGDSSRAREYFEMAWQYQDQLDAPTRQAIQDHLSKSSASSDGVRTASADDLFNEQTGQIPADDVRGSQQAMFRKLQGEVFKERAAAERLLETSPREALEKMTMVRSRIAQSEIDPDSRRPLLTIIDRDIAEMQRYIDKNLPEIINDETNAARLESVDLRRQRSIDVETQIQKLIEDFERLVEEERYAEAEMVARQAQELAPDSDVVVALTEKSKFLTRVLRMNDLEAKNEKGVWDGLRNAQASAVPMDFDTPILFDKERFEERAAMRSSQLGLGEYNSEVERTIWNLLKNQKVQGEYTGTLSSAVEQLSRQAGVNIIFDKIALAAEGVEMDSTVDVPIREPISLQSALKVILGSAGLVFVVEDEVIKVTSRDAQQKDVRPKTYYVGDLVTPITNFSSTMQMNFMQPGPAYGNQNFNNNQLGGAPLSMPVAQQNPGAMNALSIAQQSAMAQQLPGGLPGGFGGFDNYRSGPQTGTPTYSTIGPQRLGGVTEADFFPLIELIKTTVNPDSWDDSNGDGTIQAFVPNLSLIVSQTQEVQDQIQDLLKKLRELNDVQIVIEVRFITLQDNFFERVGVDFDFQINDNSNLTNPIPDNVNPSAIIGNTATGPTADLDVVFDQDSFASAIPQFGGFDVGTAANFGFAILSDIEVFFLIQASKGDTRSNIMQAPTVTMFNGQSANVTDGAQRPFVTSVTPVVGDFAVAQQPVITILPDGTSLNVQAVVSNDRRFVRMTLVPFFSQVQEVTTFTFDGTRTTRRSTNSLLDDLINSVSGDDTDPEQIAEFETETSGVTIQLPVLATTSVSTVVSVPDGGTVLMGGIKRMSEGRTERGVPFLSNIPYVNRLFKNVGIGRDTSNLMMMVTPRIIIQAEEERIQVGDLGGNN